MIVVIINVMKSKIKNIKKTIFWFYFIKFIWLPFFTIIWEYIINLHGKFLYFYFKFTKKINNHKKYFIQNNDKIVIRSNEDLKNLCDEIEEKLTDDFLNKMENNLKSKKFPDGHYLKNRQGYNIDMFPHLNENLQKKILDFATNSMNISIVTNYLKVLPKISKINLNLNIQVVDTTERGPMLWHKDDIGFKSLDLFAPIGELRDDNGPLHYNQKKNDLGVFFKITNIKKDSLKGERNKINIEIYEKFYKDTNKFIGKSGDSIFIDSFRCYHRGGFCKKNKRIMLRIAYQTPDSVNILGRNNNFSQLVKKENLDIFSKYILFMYPKFYEKIGFQNFLLRIYRLFHYKKDLSLH